jgi:hypothetical protein
MVPTNVAFGKQPACARPHVGGHLTTPPKVSALRKVPASFTILAMQPTILGNTPPTGWIARDGLLQPDPTIAGYRARMQEVHGICGKRDCKRRCEVDVQRLTALGFGALHIDTAKRFLKCENLAGCGLDFHEDRRAGLPIKALFGRSHVSVRVKCGGCDFFRTAAPEVVWRRMMAGKSPNDGLLVCDIAGQIKGPCRKCGKSNWAADVLWPNSDSQGSRRQDFKRR